MDFIDRVEAPVVSSDFSLFFDQSSPLEFPRPRWARPTAGADIINSTQPTALSSDPRPNKLSVSPDFTQVRRLFRR
jgi:hypothetical protein